MQMDCPDLSQKIVNLRAKVEIKKILCNTVQELPMMLEEIKNKALDDNFIVEMKKKVKESEVYSICNDFLIYSKKKWWYFCHY